VRDHQDTFDTANTLTRGKFQATLIERRQAGESYAQIAKLINDRWGLDVSEATVRGWFSRKKLMDAAPVGE
jgi:intein-encoded DNA endonuclease-like protein